MTGSNQSVLDCLSSKSTSEQRAVTLTIHPHVGMHLQIELSFLALFDKTGNKTNILIFTPYIKIHSLENQLLHQFPIKNLSCKL